MRYSSIGAIFGYAVAVSCASALLAVPNTASSAKPLIVIEAIARFMSLS
jgi:hypothetical protein